jgi:hypothetical protein
VARDEDVDRRHGVGLAICSCGGSGDDYSPM